MDSIKELELSLERATADLERAQQAHQTCLLNHDGAGCAEECAALQAAERRVHALEHRLAEAWRLDATAAEEFNAAFGLIFE